MINLQDVGAFPSASTPAGVNVRFGIYLPCIDLASGYQVQVCVIHKNDRLTKGIPPQVISLNFVAGSIYNLWTINASIPPQPGTSFGLPGTYLYRYQLLRNNTLVLTWFTDPFARSTDEVSQFASFTTPDVAAPFTWADQGWRVPALDDLVVYELQVEEFNDTFDGVIERLPYLQGLGVNCLELMPVSSLKFDFDWGYGPLHYFAPNERWGGVQGLKRLINACHASDIAVILDMVYQHVDDTFPYQLVYQHANIPSPMINGSGDFGPKIDFTQAFARDYIQAVNFYLLDEYHVDGFRYDEVTDLYPDPATGGRDGIGYAQLVSNTYMKSLSIPRFTPSGQGNFGEYSRIIQCAEALGLAKKVLTETFTNCAWQENLLGNAQRIAPSQSVDDAFVNALDPFFGGSPYPSTQQVRDRLGNAVAMPVAPFQYLENHDKDQFICFIGREQPNPKCLTDLLFGDRDQFFRLQPFVIALYTCQGVPMLWQGQEFADNYALPGCGKMRVGWRRNVHWEHFYDDDGKPLIRLYRILGELRRNNPALRGRHFFYDNQHSRPSDGVVAYRRQQTNGNQIAYVFLNFSGTQQQLQFPFSDPGIYREMIDTDQRINEIPIANANQIAPVTVPSHYGCIFLRQDPI